MVLRPHIDNSGAAKEFAQSVAISPIVFGKNGVVSNAFLQAFSGNSSDSSPFVAPIDFQIIALAGSSNTTTSGEVEVRINGSGTASATLTFSAADTAFSDLTGAPISLNAGDTVSSFVTNTDSIKDPVFYIFFQGAI